VESVCGRRELEDGTRIGARTVVSGAHPQTTYLDLVGEEHFWPEVVRDIRRYRTRSGSVKVNLALGELPAPTAWDGPVPGDPPPGLIAISLSVEYLERAWDEAKYGGTSSEPYIEAVLPTVHEPELAPEGKHIAPCFTQFGAHELRGRTWEEEREAYGKTVIRTLGEYCPTSRAVEEMEVLAPPDIEERFGLVGGNIFQGEMTPGPAVQLPPHPGLRGLPDRREGAVPVRVGNPPGRGVMAVPARNAACVVLRDLRHGRLVRSGPLAT